MALYLIVHNDGTGDEKTGHYNIMAMINSDVLWQGRVANYHRPDGWRTLLTKAVAAINARPSLKDAIAKQKQEYADEDS